MQVIEHGPALLQQGRHVPHELGDDDLHVVARSRHALLEGGHAQLHESLDVGAAERRDFLAESTDLVQPGGADVIAPSTPGLGIADDAGAIPAVIRIRHQPALQVTAGEDRSQRPVGNVERHHLGRLKGRAFGEIRRERLRIRAFVRRAQPPGRPAA